MSYLYEKYSEKVLQWEIQPSATEMLQKRKGQCFPTHQNHSTRVRKHSAPTFNLPILLSLLSALVTDHWNYSLWKVQEESTDSICLYNTAMRGKPFKMSF